MSFVFAGDWLPSRHLKKNFHLDGDFLIGNLECAFGNMESASDKAYTSILPTDCIRNVSSGGFAVLSVANNHVNDVCNFRETYTELTCRFPDIQFVGTTDKPFATFEHSNIRILVIACLEPCRSRGDFIFKQENVTALIRKLRSSQPQISTLIFVYPHWGKEGEYTRYPAPWQLKLAREWIDAGADGVFGSHSHVPQGREYYKGKPIYYSLGNFDFDHPESKLYEGTGDRLSVKIETQRIRGSEEERSTGDGVGNAIEVKELFGSDAARDAVERASKELAGWNVWKWAKMVGPINLKKNTASWKLRLKKNFITTLPKFLVWQFLPQTLLFRIAGLCCCRK